MWHNITYTPIGMTTTLIGQEFGCVCAILLSSTYLSLYVSTCLYISACLNDIARAIEKFDQFVPHLPRSEKKMKTEFVNILQLHEKTVR